MEVREAIKKRSSVRQYRDEPVNIDDLKEMVRMAGMAPSVNNAQPWKFIAITNKELLREMADMVRSKIDEIIPDAGESSEASVKKEVEHFSTFFASAPAVIAVLACPYSAIVDKALANTGLSHEDINAMRGYPDILSIGASVENLILTATDMGYGTCWLSGPLVAREGLEKALGIEQPWRLATLVAIGKPARDIPQNSKKPLEEIFELRE